MKKEKLDALFNKDNLIMACSLDINCPAKINAAEKLMNIGFSNVRPYEGS